MSIDWYLALTIIIPGVVWMTGLILANRPRDLIPIRVQAYAQEERCMEETNCG